MTPTLHPIIVLITIKNINAMVKRKRLEKSWKNLIATSAP
jgi:hypothetical protein